MSVERRRSRGRINSLEEFIRARSQPSESDIDDFAANLGGERGQIIGARRKTDARRQTRLDGARPTALNYRQKSGASHTHTHQEHTRSDR